MMTIATQRQQQQITESLVTHLVPGISQDVSSLSSAPFPHVVPRIGIHLLIAHALSLVRRVVSVKQAVFPSSQVQVVI